MAQSLVSHAGTLPMPGGNTMYRYWAGPAILKLFTAPKSANSGIADRLSY